MRAIIKYPFTYHVKIPGCFDSKYFKIVQEILFCISAAFISMYALSYIYNDPRATLYFVYGFIALIIWLYREGTVSWKIKNCLKKKGEVIIVNFTGEYKYTFDPSKADIKENLTENGYEIIIENVSPKDVKLFS